MLFLAKFLAFLGSLAMKTLSRDFFFSLKRWNPGLPGSWKCRAGRFLLTGQRAGLSEPYSVGTVLMTLDIGRSAPTAGRPFTSFSIIASYSARDVRSSFAVMCTTL